MDNPLKSFMSTMGTGPKSSDPLSYGEAKEAMLALLEGNYEPVTFGAFLVAERWKSETVEELSGFLDAIVQESREPVKKNPDHVDVAGKFDGKVKGVNTDLPGSLLAAAAGVRVFTHSGRNVPTKPDGVTLLDVLEQAGLNPEPSLEDSREALREVGFSYSNSSVYAPSLDGLKEDRRHLGVRCFLNTIESMLLPSGASTHVGAYYHLPFAKRVCDVFEFSRELSPDRVLMLTGMEGQAELRPGYTAIAEWKQGKFDDFDVRSEELSIRFERKTLEELPSNPRANAELLERWIDGEDVPEAYRESTILNAACRLYAGGETSSIKQGVERARTVEANGAVRSVWEQLNQRFSGR